jgi:thioredoxin reductase (NADPH)
LTAALYLARYERRFALFDSGRSRAAWIPESHNLPLFTHGIPGREVLRRQREHAELCGASIVDAEVLEASKDPTGFSLRLRQRNGRVDELKARFILFATGVEDIPPRMPGIEDAVYQGLIRYCPICDGYEAKGKRIGVIGFGNKGLGEAVFIARTYSRTVTLLSLHEPLILSDEDREKLKRHGICFLAKPVKALCLDGGNVRAISAGGPSYKFDVMYSALGVRYRSGLATALGAKASETGALEVGEHSETAVPGLYAAGDVTKGLNQIVVGMGQAARAATDIHNRL